MNPIRRPTRTARGRRRARPAVLLAALVAAGVSGCSEATSLATIDDVSVGEAPQG